jgi:Rps23 Pro-64 3,4-dihydroxylase Tpa1-like proline 4-hydroxylase
MNKSHIDTLLDFERLTAAVDDAASRYKSATPFPHIALEDFLPEAVYRRALAEYPSPEQVSDWRRVEVLDNKGRIAQNLKLGYSNEQHMGPLLRDLIYTLNSGAFLRYLERLTGIPDLLPDPHLVGGGLHQYLPGAVLRVHADFSKLRGSLLDRRLNPLLYLNQEWHPEWGGYLELWDPEMRECRERIAPTGNRCVIFSTTGTSYHGMPEPLACPAGVTRRSLALYYYSNGRPPDEAEPTHATLWQARPHEQ